MDTDHTDVKPYVLAGPRRVHSVSVVASGGLPVGLVGFLWG